MSQMVRQTTFTSGQVDIINWKRTDTEAYLSAAQSLLNCEVGTTGLVKKRKGTYLGLDVSSYIDPNSNLYQFTDKNNNYYVLLSSNEAINVFSFIGGVLTYVTTVSTPYVSNDLSAIDYSLDNDVLILTHPSYPPARFYISSYGPVVFSYQVLNIYPLPAFDFGEINYANFVVSLTGDTSTVTFEFTGLSSDPGFTTAWIGGQIIGAGNSVQDPVAYAIITNVVPFSGGTVTFTAQVQIPFNLSSPALIGNQYSIKQPAWSTALGWPAKVLIYQNRLWLANTLTLENTIFGSQINNFVNFDPGIGNDTDAIIYTIGQNNSGAILWMNGGKQLEIYTQNFEFACPQQEALALTPGTFSIRQQSANGSSKLLKPITYINDSYYVTREGNAIINFHYNGIGQTYTSTNISASSTSLVLNPSNAVLLRGTDQSQDNFIYFLNPDYTLTSFQFAYEYKLAALSPLNFNTDPGNVVQVLDITGINNNVLILKKYVNNSKYIIDVMSDNYRADSRFPCSMDSSGFVTGLDILDGYIVTLEFNPTGTAKQDYGQSLQIVDGVKVVAAVSSGSCYFDNPNEDSGNGAVCLPYSVEIVPMYIFAGALQSNYYKDISRIFVDYYQSLDFRIDGKLVPYQEYANIQAGLPLMPQTGTAIISPVRGWNRFDTFSITQNSIFDLQVLGIAYQVEAAII